MQSHDIIELAFVAIAALALLTQAVVMIAIYLGISKMAGDLKGEIADIRSKFIPTLIKTRDMVDRATPRIERAISDAADVASLVRIQAVALEGVSGEILERVRKETGRVDTMFSGALDALDKASQFVTHTVSKPVRQMSGILASIKAIVEALSAPNTPYPHQPYRETRIHDDKDMFV